MIELYFDKENHNNINIERKYIGSINIPSGAIVTSDPFYLSQDCSILSKKK